MKTIRPVYYEEFQCIAGACPQTCCREWKIAVDDGTYQKWKDTRIPGSDDDRPGSRVWEKDGGRIIRLNDKKECPFWNAEGLCSLVLAYGNEILSHACRVFPRQRQEFADRTEDALVLCCPAVADLIRKRGARLQTREGKPPSSQDILFAVRAHVMEILDREEFPLSKAFFMAFYEMKELFGKFPVSSRKELLDGLKEWKKDSVVRDLCGAIDGMGVTKEERLTEQNELFLDMVENYRKEGLYSSCLEPIAGLAEAISEGKEDFTGYPEFETAAEPYEGLLRSCAVTEIYTSLLKPESDPESMLVMLQWISMEFAILRQALFLKWRLDGKKPLAYETVREYLVVMARITGYDEEDIFEYMENSFEELIWDYGYMALLV